MPETFVLDCSVAAKWMLPEPGRAPALELFRRYVQGEITLIAPDLLLAEFASLMAKRSRRNLISMGQARQAYSLMARYSPRLFDTRPLLSRAFELSLRHQLSLWDCVYLGLAAEHDCPVLTADRRLFHAGKARHSSLVLVA